MAETLDVVGHLCPQAKYSWKQAECLDAGTYSCTADNGVGALVSVAAELKVLCQ